MRKIYPPLSVLVLYGLLSIAVTTLAQEIPADPLDPLSSCKFPQINPASTKQVTIGYIQLFPKQPDLKNFPWDSYDYINIIAYPNNDDNEWNDIFRPKDPKVAEILKPIGDFKAKKPPTAKTKFLLSIRNYNPSQWPGDPDGPDGYNKIVEDAVNTIDDYDLDGVDIEYPGMRGLICHEDPDGFGPDGPKFIWDKGKDAAFLGFMGKLKEEMDKTDAKTIMLTVGSEVIAPNNLNDNIRFLNIETYHFSLYQNLRPPLANPNIPNVKSHPNAPLDIFTNAHDAWINSGIGKEKIIMGVDFGNTFQVVANPEIKNNQAVDFVSTQELQQFDVKKIDGDIKRINNICPNEENSIDFPVYDRLRLYSWPWKHLSESVLDLNNCKAKDDWEINPYNKDQASSTPWLFKADDINSEYYYYVSYEDINSISTKSNYSIGKSIGGMSVSDVSYDNTITKGSLLNIMQAIRGKKPENPSNGEASPKNSGTNSGKSPSPTATDPAAGAGETNKGNLVNKKGAIAGGVIGGLLCLIILGACAFIGYRYRKKPKSESFRSLLMSIPSSFKNHSTASRNTEMTFDPSPNLLAPPTTVIPVASGYVTAMFDFTGKEENDLSFKKGDKIEVLERGDGPNDWWVGRVNGAVGEFPGNYVKET